MVETQQLPGANVGLALRGNLLLGRESEALMQLCLDIASFLAWNTPNTSGLSISMPLFRGYLVMSSSLFFQGYYFTFPVRELWPHGSSQTSTASLLDCQPGIRGQTLS